MYKIIFFLHYVYGKFGPLWLNQAFTGPDKYHKHNLLVQAQSNKKLKGVIAILLVTDNSRDKNWNYINILRKFWLLAYGSVNTTL